MFSLLGMMLLFLLNFGISVLNAYATGRSWDMAKLAGGWAYLVSWAGYVMAICGFTWCYLFVLGIASALVPFVPSTAEDGTQQFTTLLTLEQTHVFFDLGYLLIVFPVLGAGMVLVVSSWREFARRRTFGSGAVAGWNALAQGHNMYTALSHVPEAGANVAEFFGGLFKPSSGSDSKNANAMLATIVIALALAAALGGWLTASVISNAARRAEARSIELRYAELYG